MHSESIEPNSTGEEVESQRGEVTCSRLHKESAAELGLEAWSQDSSPETFLSQHKIEQTKANRMSEYLVKYSHLRREKHSHL